MRHDPNYREPTDRETDRAVLIMLILMFGAIWLATHWRPHLRGRARVS